MSDFEIALNEHMTEDCGAYQQILAAHIKAVADFEEVLKQDLYLRELALEKERAALDAYRAELQGFHHFQELLKCLRQSEPQS